MTPLAEIADSFFKPAVRDLVPYEPGKPVEEVQRELGLERVVKLASNEGPIRPVSGGSRRPRAARARAEPVPGRRLVPTARCSRRAARRALRGDRAGCGLRRHRRLSLSARARSRRRDRVRLAVVPELRHRRTEARCRRPPGAASRAPLRPGRDARGCRAEDEARLRLSPEQPDRDDEHAGRARRLLRPCARPRADGARPGLLPSTSIIPTTRTASRRI